MSRGTGHAKDCTVNLHSVLQGFNSTRIALHSSVCSSGRLVVLVCKTCNIICYLQTFHPASFTRATVIGIISIYRFISWSLDLILNEGHKLSRSQTMFDLFSRTVLKWSCWSLIKVLQYSVWNSCRVHKIRKSNFRKRSQILKPCARRIKENMCPGTAGKVSQWSQETEFEVNPSKAHALRCTSGNNAEGGAVRVVSSKREVAECTNSLRYLREVPFGHISNLFASWSGQSLSTNWLVVGAMSQGKWSVWPILGLLYIWAFILFSVWSGWLGLLCPSSGNRLSVCSQAAFDAMFLLWET